MDFERCCLADRRFARTADIGDGRLLKPSHYDLPSDLGPLTN
jgi:hypothetical protein